MYIYICIYIYIYVYIYICYILYNGMLWQTSAASKVMFEKLENELYRQLLDDATWECFSRA